MVYELECIWSSGKYHFDVASEVVLLKFEHSQVLVVPGNYCGHNLTATVEWKEEQVKDFIHKLGFLECNEEQRKRQDTFMRVTDVSINIIDTYSLCMCI